MLADPRSSAISQLVSVAIVLSAVVAALYAARVLGRQRRRRERQEWQSIARELRHHLRGSSSAERLARIAARAESGVFWTALERFALRARSSALRRLAAVLDRSPHVRLERQRLRDDSPWRRELAARRLGLLPSRRSCRALRRALVHGPEPVTLAAARALARHRDRASLRWWLRHPEALARRSRRALRELLEAFGHRGLPEIAAALESGIPHATLELAAIDVLGLGGYRGARDRFERLLVDGATERRIAAARALGELRAAECASALLVALRDEAWQVRAQAARALGRAGTPVAVTALAARLTDPSWWVRRHAAYALLEMGEAGRSALRHVVATTDDRYARDMAREALDGGIGRLTA